MADNTISIADDKNDDWLKKIKGGKYKKTDLKAHREARKKGKKSK